MSKRCCHRRNRYCMTFLFYPLSEVKRAELSRGCLRLTSPLYEKWESVLLILNNDFSSGVK